MDALNRGNMYGELSVLVSNGKLIVVLGVVISNTGSIFPALLALNQISPTFKVDLLHGNLCNLSPPGGAGTAEYLNDGPFALILTSISDSYDFLRGIIINGF